jgi:CRISPR/Cas system CMR-associated protein Cmr5 small subunit
MREEEKEIRANMKQVDENIYDILVEFMATRPDRDYSLEAHSTKEEIAEGREKNIEHIKNFIPSIKDLISQACSSQLKEVEERIFQDVNIPAEVCKYIREKILAEVEKLV